MDRKYYKLIDGSWIYEIVDGELVDTFPAWDKWDAVNKWYILGDTIGDYVGEFLLPTKRRGLPDIKSNNTIVINYYDNSRVLFTRRDFLAEIGTEKECSCNVCPHCGGIKKKGGEVK